MIFDRENQLSVAQSFTGAATVSTDSFDTKTAARDITIGRRMSLLVFFSAAGAGTTHTLQAIQDSAAALNDSPDVLAQVVITTANLPDDGSPVEIPLPQGVMTKRYLGFRHSAASGTTTATVDVYLVPQDEIPKWKSFPKVNHADIVIP